MQIRTGLWTKLILCLVFLQNCVKNDNQQLPNKPSLGTIITLQQAQSWVNTHIGSSNSRQSETNFIGTPAWNRKTEILVPATQGILKVALENYKVAFGYRDLLFQQLADGNTRSIVQQVFADSAYLASKIPAHPTTSHGIRYYVNNDDFTGDVIYLNPQTNTFLYGWRYQNGHVKYRLKPVTPSSARSGGGPIDDDETSGDDGGGGDKGWSGSGNNTDGYTIDGPVITAPAPSNPSTPTIPPLTDPGSVNPPTIPVGGGGQSGGTGGPKNDPKNDENYEDPKAPDAAVPCPISFNFIKTGDWQSAVISNYYFEYDERAFSGKFFTINIGAIEVGLPRLTYDGSLIQPDVAQRIAAQAAYIAEAQTLALITAYLMLNPKATQRDIDNNPLYLQAFKEDYREAINQFLRADYGYKNNASPATISTSQAQFVLKDKTKWLPLKFRGRDC